jgi:quercetin dioxygenase-like cupin family protein
MYGVKVRRQDGGWTPLDFPGVSMRVLFKDPATGAMAVVTRMDAGAVIPAHFHTKADETVFVIDGDFVEDGETFGPGSYFVGKAGTTHGPHGTAGGCSLLTHFSDDLDFQLAGPGGQTGSAP